MVQSLRHIKRRIRSIENTEKITHALEMIATSRLKGLQDKLGTHRDFFVGADKIFKNLSADEAVLQHPFFKKPGKKDKVLIYVITSDTGLCGSYNENVIRAVGRFSLANINLKIDILASGKTGKRYFKKKNYDVFDTGAEWRGHYNERDIDTLTKILIDDFFSGEFSAVYAAYTHYESASRLKVVVEKIFPMEKNSSKPFEYLYEANKKSVMEKYFNFYVYQRMRWIVLNALVSEHTARGMAMAEATDNAKDLLEGLILLRNKVRQANITREIIEVISSVEALKG